MSDLHSVKLWGLARPDPGAARRVLCMQVRSAQSVPDVACSAPLPLKLHDDRRLRTDASFSTPPPVATDSLISDAAERLVPSVCHIKLLEHVLPVLQGCHRSAALTGPQSKGAGVVPYTAKCFMSPHMIPETLTGRLLGAPCCPCTYASVASCTARRSRGAMREHSTT